MPCRYTALETSFAVEYARSVYLIFIFWLVVASAVAVCDARAQEGPGVGTTEPHASAKRISYDEYRRVELAYLAKRSRTGLLSTSAATAVGVALVAPALAKECVRIASSASSDDLRCTTTGKRLLGVGVPILVAGAMGILVTAIMFGVRRGKLRSVEDRIAYDQHRAVRWDPARAAFSF